MGELSLHTGNLIGRFVRDRRANAAIEFSFIVPLMIGMFFATVEFSSAIAAKGKVTLVARTLSDVAKVETNTSPIFWMALSGDRTQQQIKQYAINVVKKRIESRL